MTEREELFRDIKTRYANVLFIEEIEQELAELNNCDLSRLSRVDLICRRAKVTALHARRAQLLGQLGADTHA